MSPVCVGGGGRRNTNNEKVNKLKTENTIKLVANKVRTDCADFDEFGIGYDVGGYIKSNVLFERRILPEIDEKRLVLIDGFAFGLIYIYYRIILNRNY